MELKYLKAYLDCGVGVINTCDATTRVQEGKHISKLVHGHNGMFGVEGLTPISFFSNPDGSFKKQDHLKLILRPLSDLTKEIEHNGVKFVPIEMLKEIRESKHKTMSKQVLFFILARLSNPDLPIDYKIKSCHYWIVEKLIEWHFDIFGLIEKGFAIYYCDCKK